MDPKEISINTSNLVHSAQGRHYLRALVNAVLSQLLIIFMYIHRRMFQIDSKSLSIPRRIFVFIKISSAGMICFYNISDIIVI
jgi:hypothetical protein